MPKTVKEEIFLRSILLQNFYKIEGGLFKKFSKKKQKMRNFNDSFIVPKNLDKGTLWVFLTFVLLQDIKQKEGWTLCRH